MLLTSPCRGDAINADLLEVCFPIAAGSFVWFQIFLFRLFFFPLYSYLTKVHTYTMDDVCIFLATTLLKQIVWTSNCLQLVFALTDYCCQARWIDFYHPGCCCCCCRWWWCDFFCFYVFAFEFVLFFCFCCMQRFTFFVAKHIIQISLKNLNILPGIIHTKYFSLRSFSAR